MDTICGRNEETVGENIYKNLVTIAEAEARRRNWGSQYKIDNFLCKPDQTGDINKGKLVISHAKCKICNEYLVKRDQSDGVRLVRLTSCGTAQTDLRKRHIVHDTCLSRSVRSHNRTCPDCSKPF